MVIFHSFLYVLPDGIGEIYWLSLSASNGENKLYLSMACLKLQLQMEVTSGRLGILNVLGAGCTRDALDPLEAKNGWNMAMGHGTHNG